jgi:hypothetical protein
MGMDCQTAPQLAELARKRTRSTPASGENKFDGTKLSIEGPRPKTTTGGINCPIYPKFDIAISVKMEAIKGWG